jgi:hypothetical protein
MDSMSKRLALLVVLAWSGPVAAQHVYKCVNWQGAVTYQSERCSDRDRIDRVYDTNREIEVDGRVVRNFVPSTSAHDPGLSRRYGSPQNADGSYKSDALCGVVTAATNGTGVTGISKRSRVMRGCAPRIAITRAARAAESPRSRHARSQSAAVVQRGLHLRSVDVRSWIANAG